MADKTTNNGNSKTGKSAQKGMQPMATTPAAGAPIVIQKPVVHILVDGATDEVDVSCDVSQIDLAPEQGINKVKRFCGSVQVPGLLEETCGIDYVVNDTTYDTWAPFVGKTVTVKVWTSATDTKGRVFKSFIGFNPGLYGTFEPGEPLLVAGQSLPIMTPIAVGTGAPA